MSLCPLRGEGQPTSGSESFTGCGAGAADIGLVLGSFNSCSCGFHLILLIEPPALLTISSRLPEIQMSTPLRLVIGGRQALEVLVNLNSAQLTGQIVCLDGPSLGCSYRPRCSGVTSCPGVETWWRRTHSCASHQRVPAAWQPRDPVTRRHCFTPSTRQRAQPSSKFPF